MLPKKKYISLCLTDKISSGDCYLDRKMMCLNFRLPCLQACLSLIFHAVQRLQLNGIRPLQECDCHAAGKADRERCFGHPEGNRPAEAQGSRHLCRPFATVIPVYFS